MRTELALTKPQIEDACMRPNLQHSEQRRGRCERVLPNRPVSQGGLPGGGDILSIYERRGGCPEWKPKPKNLKNHFVMFTNMHEC